MFCITDPDLLAARLSAQEARTQQLQEKYNERLEEYKRKQEEVMLPCWRFSVVLKCDFFLQREARKREEVLHKTEAQLQGHVLGESSKKTLRPGKWSEILRLGAVDLNL